MLRPLDEMVCADPQITPEGLERLSARTGYSRFPVRDGAHLLGYLHVKDALHQAARDEPFPADACRPIGECVGKGGIPGRVGDSHDYHSP